MRERILATADQLFYAEGIRAVGMDRLIAQAGVAKATMYHHFPSKEQLVVDYLRRRHALVTAAMQLALAAAGAGPAARVQALFGWLQSRVAAGSFRGCAFLLALSEYGHSAEVREAVRAHKDAVAALFASAVGAELSAAQPPLPRQLALLYDGAIASVAVQGDAAAIGLAARMAGSLLPPG
ncbi:TetR/AcrR family transcriptional regulator [Pseudorhodoferax sp.]|uniref:TetR/AcrR family transcriptional regulator n=1 Tax=Pseudorhodoferax sp. TaxID=1993553 RepID=UPI002DD6AF26|nr:helix-turn-helix domain-containing protein [Pseudorhodoferax sp.]